MKKILLALLLAFSATTLAVAGVAEAPKAAPQKPMVKKHKARAKKPKKAPVKAEKAKETTPSPAPAGQPSPQY
ncbi:hypothetical protein JCM13664_15010 [Methylothermus subterraneus]